VHKGGLTKELAKKLALLTVVTDRDCNLKAPTGINPADFAA
jgi:hypothetical protein